MKELAGKVAVVTGAGSGIGRSIAHALAKAKVNVVVADIRSDAAREVCAEVEALGAEAIAVEVNVADHGSVQAMADSAYSRFRHVDILVNNAGVSWRPLRPVSDATLSDWKFMIDVNLWGVINGLDVFLPRMSKQQGEKHVVNTSSLAGLWPVKGHTPYSATKAAVTAISEGLASDLAEEGFGVTILHPAMVRTNVVANSEAMRSDVDKGEGRTFRSMVDERMEKLAAAYIDAEAVGEMVRDAIERNQLYLHTHPIEAQDIRSRTELIYGADTYGRA
ncbi:SDR family NAD(P)-dependent oxidoreductase [Aquibium sp. LZ166]|uniref:SDR family NAD(P)-dependent oxidoreductase n=1 Tax=Aquibium pacificus TaxID=3153579 RepID=A0ABV3SMB6_9HYPH